MEKPRRVSIGTLCVVVAVAALDFAWWKHIARPWFFEGPSLLGFHGSSLDAGAIPMASVLVIGIAYVRSNQGKIPRWLLGFLWGGLAGLLLYCVYCWAWWILPRRVVMWSTEPIHNVKSWLNRLGFSISYYPHYTDSVCYSPPQFLLALIVGWLWRKRDKNM
jgi:hypothetical protein